MQKTSPRRKKANKVASAPKFILNRPKTWWYRSVHHKVALIFAAIIIFSTGSMYGIAQWYIYRHANEPIKMGATFIPDYARFFGLDAEATMQAMIDELGIKRFRLVSYWSKGEPSPGVYDFSELDWQFQKAEAAGAKVSLALGLRQPRWPECHMPKWAEPLPMSQWQPRLETYIQKVVERYRNSPALESYQLENEFFLKAFGICPDYSRSRLVSEFNVVKKADPRHTLVVSMSNNALGTPVGDPTPDKWAISVYKRVWDKTISKRYVEYPFPAWYYAFRAGWVELTRGRTSFIHELQAEAWMPEGFEINNVRDLKEQDKSLNAERLQQRFEYGRATGMKTIDLWGAEWWYWRKVKANDPSLWNVAKAEYAKTEAHNQTLDR